MVGMTLGCGVSWCDGVCRLHNAYAWTGKHALGACRYLRSTHMPNVWFLEVR